MENEKTIISPDTLPLKKNRLNKIIKKPIFYISLVLVIFVLSSLILLLKISSNSNKYNQNTSLNNLRSNITTTLINTSTVKATSIPSSDIVTTVSSPYYVQLENLNLIHQPTNFSPTEYPIEYFQSGVIPSGKYQGYKRILAVNNGISADGITNTEVFATNNDSTYIIDNSSDHYSSMDEFNKNTIYNLSKVVGYDDLLSNFPSSIKFNNSFSAIRSYYSLEPDKIKYKR